MLGAAHGQQGHDVASSKATPNGSRIVAAIPEHTVWSLSRSAPCALQRGNRIDQRQASCESFRFAPVRRTASGTPRPSQSRWRLLPRLARSVGFGPVWSPPYTARMEQCPRPPGTNQSDRRARANPAAQSGSDPTPPPVASRASDASTSSPTRMRVPAGASARERRCGGRRRCR